MLLVYFLSEDVQTWSKVKKRFVIIRNNNFLDRKPFTLTKLQHPFGQIREGIILSEGADSALLKNLTVPCSRLSTIMMLLLTVCSLRSHPQKPFF